MLNIMSRICHPFCIQFRLGPPQLQIFYIGLDSNMTKHFCLVNKKMEQCFLKMATYRLTIKFVTLAEIFPTANPLISVQSTSGLKLKKLQRENFKILRGNIHNLRKNVQNF